MGMIKTGKKDLSEKVLARHNDVFADIVNVLLFDGENVVKEDELTDALPQAIYKAAGIKSTERDVAKFWRNNELKISLFGLENQTDTDANMPLRMAAYDGVSYREQLKDEKPRPYPVISLVLYFGTDKPWDKAKTLAERIDVDQRLKPYFNDYKMNLFELAYLDEETAQKFTSDFRYVVDYCRQMQQTGDYEPKDDGGTLKHEEEILTLLSIMNGDDRFEEHYYEVQDKGVSTMTGLWDKIVNKGRVEGMAEGMTKGKLENKIEIAINLLKLGKNAIEDIAAVTNLSVSEVQKLAIENGISQK